MTDTRTNAAISTRSNFMAYPIDLMSETELKAEIAKLKAENRSLKVISCLS